MTAATVCTDVPPAIAAWLTTAPRLTPERIAHIRRLLGPAPEMKSGPVGTAIPNRAA